MGLEGLGDESGAGTDSSAPALARAMEDKGTNAQNADILNLILADADLLVAAPPPVGAARTTEPVESLVYNSNFTRERYGKAAVNDNISLDSSKKSLLLNNNQSSAQKALAFISCLEFDNGLRVLQNEFSNGDVTGNTQPDLDTFNRYPESMFNNALQLNQTKETYVFDAIDSSGDATAAFTSFQ